MMIEGLATALVMAFILAVTRGNILQL
jgi:hypothetical protein